MTALNKQALREAAENALQGKWDWEAGAIWNTNESGWVQHMATVDAGDEVSDEEHKNNMLFITAATPSVVLAMLDEQSELETRVVNESDCADSTINLAINWQMRCKDAEAKLEAAERRIAELEARTVTLPPTFWYEHDDLSRDIPVLDKRLVKKAIRAAGIGVKGE